MERTINIAIAQGKTDDQVLSLIAATYGNDVLITPAFQGFNMLLWIVPVAGALIAVGAMVVMQKRTRRSQR